MKFKSLILSLGLIVGLSVTAMADPLIYVAAGSANKVLVIDAETNKVVKEFGGISNPHALVITPDGEYVISGSLSATKNKSGKNEGTLYVIHPAHGHVMSTLPLPGMVHHQAITPSGRFVVSTHPALKGISITDMEGEFDPWLLETGAGPNYTVFTKDGKRAYVSNTGSGTISEINPQTWMVERQLAGGKTPEHMALSADEKWLYVINAMPGTVSKVSIKSGKVVASYKIGKGAHGLGMSEDGQSIFATSKKSGVVAKIDLETNAIEFLNLSPSPYHLESLKGTGKVYVSSSKSPRIWVLDAKKFELLDEIAISGEGHQMAATQAHTD